MLGKQAKEIGFLRDTYEKVCRLTEILKFFKHDAVLGSSLALKGGMKDSTKVGINYMLRYHVLEIQQRHLASTWESGSALKSSIGQ